MSPVSKLESGTRLAEAFSAWADTYDYQQNPLLTLEERYLSQLLPKMQGRDVLDVGCGTGRWLAHLSRLNPRSQHGVDPSPEMLAKAREKRIPGTHLAISSCIDLPLENNNVDVLLASFVLSYVDNLDTAANEFARVARPGCDLFLSDMHPETAAHLHWNRSFRNGESEIRLDANQRGISEILASFKAVGFVERVVVEPAFGGIERQIFASHNKLENYEEAEGLPAIYLLQLSKTHVAATGFRNTDDPETPQLLSGAHLALGPQERIAASVSIDTQEIGVMTGRAPAILKDSASRIDLSDYLLLPGLINAHDHLEFALFPRLGKGPYESYAQWGRDIHEREAEVIAVHERIPKQTRLWWGGIHNLLNGVTTVCHHNPIDPLLLEKDFPVRVISRFRWDHSLSFGVDIRGAHARTQPDEPFVIHACEGTDEQSKAELRKLDELAVLDQRTALVHGLALDSEGAALLNQRGAALITCPSSNDFLFGKIPSAEVLGSIARLALGSDSPLTSAGGLLDEIRYASHVFAMPPQKIYSLVTDSSASILWLQHGEGSLRPGARADLIAVRDQKRDPAEILSSLRTSDIELVLLSGRVQLASKTIFERLPHRDRTGLEPLSFDGAVRWVRAPIEDLLREAENVLGRDQVHLGGKTLCRPSF